MEIASCLVITKFLLAAWSLLSALEWFFNLHLFRPNGLLSWVVLRLRPALISAPAIRPYVHSEGMVISVLLCRIAAALALLTPYPNPVDLPCSIIILFSCFYMSRRTWFGGDGSDQMGMVVAAGVAIMSAGLVFNDKDVALAGVLAIGGQATLAYFVAGAAKLASPVWREGGALMGVMKTQSYGHVFAVDLRKLALASANLYAGRPSSRKCCFRLSCLYRPARRLPVSCALPLFISPMPISWD